MNRVIDKLSSALVNAPVDVVSEAVQIGDEPLRSVLARHDELEAAAAPLR